mmetsp:Transcript_151702/g.486756  ORF Transcript_151702/g.486756 Transcript_151702/m.486756 type:complete len:466 (-) Transcript_151702:20-1417(-)
MVFLLGMASLVAEMLQACSPPPWGVFLVAVPSLGVPQALAEEGVARPGGLRRRGFAAPLRRGGACRNSRLGAPSAATVGRQVPTSRRRGELASGASIADSGRRALPLIAVASIYLFSGTGGLHPDVLFGLLLASCTASMLLRSPATAVLPPSPPSPLVLVHDAASAPREANDRLRKRNRFIKAIGLRLAPRPISWAESLAGEKQRLRRMRIMGGARTALSLGMGLASGNLLALLGSTIGGALAQKGLWRRSQQLSFEEQFEAEWRSVGEDAEAVCARLRRPFFVLDEEDVAGPGDADSADGAAVLQRWRRRLLLAGRLCAGQGLVLGLVLGTAGALAGGSSVALAGFGPVVLLLLFQQILTDILQARDPRCWPAVAIACGAYRVFQLFRADRALSQEFVLLLRGEGPPSVALLSGALLVLLARMATAAWALHLGDAVCRMSEALTRAQELAAAGRADAAGPDDAS